MQEIEELTKAIIVGVNTGNEEYFSYQFTELANLCEARGIEVVDNVIQNLPHPNNKSYVGSGKLTEIATLKDAYGIDLIVVLDELSPVQLKNMEDALNCEVIDRTMLILEIFQLRAKTKEAILQVEIANLKYMLPRLVGSYTNLSRMGGGGGGGAGARRGSGETKLEEDRRHIERRIQKATEELKEIVLSRQVARKARKANNTKTVAFVGYTNAGKSSTINTLLNYFDKDSDKQVFVKNMFKNGSYTPGYLHKHFRYILFAFYILVFFISFLIILSYNYFFISIIKVIVYKIIHVCIRIIRLFFKI